MLHNHQYIIVNSMVYIYIKMSSINTFKINNLFTLQKHDENRKI